MTPLNLVSQERSPAQSRLSADELVVSQSADEIAPLALARFADEYVKLLLELDRPQPVNAEPMTVPLRIA